MNAFSSMEYPHWLIVVGAVLLVLGFVGIALRRRAIKGDLDEDMASDQGQREPEAELGEAQGADRKAKLEEQKRNRWAARERGSNEPLNDTPKIYDKDSK